MSQYKFQVLGPFDVPVVGKGPDRKIDCRPARQVVFDQAKELVGGAYDIQQAIGLYVFGLSPSGSPRLRPYYVGKACQQSLWVRTFQLSDKPRVYREILHEYDSARPFMFLLPLLTPSRRLAAVGSNTSRIDVAEAQLIGVALQANFELWNVKHRAGLESFVIDGIHPIPGRRAYSASIFREMLDF